MRSACGGSARAPILVTLFSFALSVVLSTPAHGQYAVLDVKQFSATAPINTAACPAPAHTPLSADMCGQIQAAICALPVDGFGNPYGVVDARGFSGAQTCGSNPFASPTISTGLTLFTTEGITLLLGPVTVDMQATWFLPQKTLVKGAGSSATVLQADGSVGAFTYWATSTNNCIGTGSTNFCVPMICMGSPISETGSGGPALSCETPHAQTNTPRTQVESLDVDGTSIAGSALIANITAEEKSWVKNVQFAHFTNVALTLGPIGTKTPPQGFSQNSGSYTDLEINGPAGSCSPTNPEYGIFAGNSIQTTFGSGGHITFTGSCTTPGSKLIAMDINGVAATVQNVHCEKWYDCLLAGDQTATSITASNLTSGAGAQNTIHISANQHTNGLLTNIYQATSGKNAIFDEQPSPSVTITAGASGITVPSYVAGTSADQAYNLPGLTLNNGSASSPSLTFANSTGGFGLYGASGTSIGLGVTSTMGDSHQFTTGGNVNIISGGVFGMSSSTTDATTAADTGISRDAAGVVDVGTGTFASTAGTLRVSRLQTGSLTPSSCTFTSGGGLSPSCAFDAGSTDSAGIIVATTGTSPGGTGTITLTFSSTFGSHKPPCIYMAGHSTGTGVWNGLAAMQDLTPTTASDVFTWTNGTVPTNLSGTTAYWINYHCWAK